MTKIRLCPREINDPSESYSHLFYSYLSFGVIVHMLHYKSVCIFSNSFIVLFLQLLHHAAVKNLKGCVSPLKLRSTDIRSLSLVWRNTAYMRKNLETFWTTYYLLVTCLQRINCGLCLLNDNYSNASYA